MRERSREESRTKTKEMSQETTTTKRTAGEEIIFKEREPSSMKKQERQTQDSPYRTLRQWNKDTTNFRRERMQTSST